MNIRDLHYFIAVTELRHFGRAAKRCAVSQPTLSGQIRKLEDTLGVTLFERDNRTVRLTRIGEQIAEIARELLDAERRIYETARSSQSRLGGQFRLGAFPTLAAYLLPSFVMAARDRIPDLSLVFVEDKTESLIDALASGQMFCRWR